MRSVIIALSVNSIASAAWAAAPAASQPSAGGSTAIALFILIAAIAGWIALRQLVRGMRASKAKSAVGASFPSYALEALVNAAKIDGRVNDEERRAVMRAMVEIGGPTFDAGAIEGAFTNARLTKDELVAYLATQARAFSREQKVSLLKALLSVFVADGRFDETEHAALVDYTAAIGFDRQSAPQMLKGLTHDFARGNIT